MAKNPEQTEDFERTMCLLLGLEPGSLVKEPEKKGMTAAQALTVIRDEILENRRIMQENFEKIWNKLNTNTVQLEKIKDKVNTMSKTDYDKAVEWLKDKMAGGRYDGAKTARGVRCSGNQTVRCYESESRTWSKNPDYRVRKECESMVEFKG